MSVLDDVKGGLKTPQGKAIAAVVTGGLAYLWWTRGRAGVPAGDQGDVTTTDRVPAGGSGGGGGGQTGTTADRPADNEAWLQRAVSVLSNPPYNNDPIAVYDALRRALDGLSITAAQQAMVSNAIGVVGSPPNGMPPLNTTAPDTSKPAPDIVSPGNTPYTTVVKAGDTLSGLASHYWGKPGDGWRIYYANVSTIENAAKRAGHATSNNGAILIPGTVLDIPPVL